MSFKSMLGLSPYLTITEQILGGHISIGNLTVYGANAMHWGVTYYTNKWGFICFRLPFFCFGNWWPLYFYVSPNATPWASTYYRSTSKVKLKEEADERWKKYGHNFDTEVLKCQ